MKAKNFRIGNLVEEPEGCTHKVERVDELKISIPHLTGFGFVKDDNGNDFIADATKRYYLTKDRQGNYQLLNELAYEKKLIYG